MKWLIDLILGKALGAFVSGLLQLRDKKKAEHDALEADRGRDAVIGQAKANAARIAIDQAGEDARNDPNPDMSDWS